MSDTAVHLDEWGVRHGGVVIEKGGYKVAFLSFMDPEIAPFDVGRPDLAAVRRAKESADIAVVAVHWGTELSPHASERQKKLAREIIDAGAAVVWGHHPHVIQEIERYNGGAIFYSLGNFIFSHLTPKITRGMIAGVRFRGTEIIGIYEHVINNDNYRVLFSPKIQTA
jgi:poly-gamma-glutamate synthesis protein (capsule biosynthesis protein)